ncbi:hypothetical protein KAI04_02585 [Candidatus Pacearchaeota archaeon]|nr:hypothetical protein [Candidatus Pacearchaeota archaeon]
MVNKRKQGSSYDSSFKIGSRLIKNKKAQLKIQQTAFMLLAITIFFVLVGLFVLMFRMGGMRETASVLEQDNAMLLISRLANSPEFACGTAFGTSKVDCIDFDKVMALKENSEKYKDFWGVSNIEIRKIYPVTGSEIECDSFTYPNCNFLQIKEGELTGYSVSNFVSLCRKESFEGYPYNKCELAKLIVSYESVQ